MKIVIVDDALDSLEKRILYFLDCAEGRYTRQTGLEFPDLQIVAVPLFPSENLVADLSEQLTGSEVVIWDHPALLKERDVFVRKLVQELSLRDLIIWDYRMPSVPWIGNSYTTSLEVLSEIRRKRPCHAVVVTLTMSIHPAAVPIFQKYFSPDEIMRADDDATPDRLRDLLKRLIMQQTEIVPVWIGVTGERFMPLRIERREVELRKRYSGWFIDETTGILEVDGQLISTSLRLSRETYATLWDLIVNPQKPDLRGKPSPRVTQRIHAIRNWFASTDEEQPIQSKRSIGYAIEPGIPVLIVASDDIISHAERIAPDCSLKAT